MPMNEMQETLLVSIPAAAIAGAGGVGLGLLALKKPVKLGPLGTVSPAVLGTAILAGIGFVGYGLARHFGKGRAEYNTAGKVALFGGVAGLGAFSAAVASSKYVESKSGAAQTASFGEGLEFAGEEAYEGGGAVPSPRILGQQSYSEFTGPVKPGLSPTYYVTVLD